MLTGLCLDVVKLPEEIVYGRILPALGIALPIGNLYYAYLAWRLARGEGRNDVTAMPYGPSVPHMFIVVFVIMLPIYFKTNDRVAGLALGPGVVPRHRGHRAVRCLRRPHGARITPRAAMLGTLVGSALPSSRCGPPSRGGKSPGCSFCR